MSDMVAPEVYRELVARAGLDPAIVREVEIKPGRDDCFGPGTYLKLGESVEIPGYGRARFIGLAHGREPRVDLPPGIEQTGTWFVPAHNPELAAAPASPEEYWARKAVLAGRIGSMKGRLQLFRGREAGWLPVVERAVDAIVRIMASCDVVELSMEEDSGSLFVIALIDCPDPDRAGFIRRISEWARAASVRRCALLGTTGWYGPIDQDYCICFTLSDQARALDASSLIARIYPSPPTAPEGNGDA